MLSIHNIMFISLNKGGRKMLKNRVKELRARHNFTQSDLGKFVGVTRQTIAFIEKGEFSPSITLALKISKELKEPIEKIFWLEEDEQ